MSGTDHTFMIAFQPPPRPHLRTYDRHLPALSQPPEIPFTFLSAAAIREEVFVHEHGYVSLGHHLDTDDARSCHWALYNSSHGPTNLTPLASSRLKAQGGLPISIKQDLEAENEEHESKAVPIGTIRLTPFPHYGRHPLPGSHQDGRQSFGVPPPPTEAFFALAPTYVPDRATSLHDGIEPYIQLGRLCVLKEWRGKGGATLLIQEALKWIGENPDFAYQRSAAEDVTQEMKWKGLVGVTAIEDAIGTWQRNGFVLDEGMGEWLVSGRKHFGLWLRLDIKDRVKEDRK